VLSSPTASRYKIGKHTGSIDALISRYITAIPDIRIDIFLEDVGHLEHHIHDRLKEFRISNMRGNKSEWFSCSLETIQHTIRMVRRKYGPIIKPTISLKERLASVNTEVLSQ
jgi:hypothetical protein